MTQRKTILLMAALLFACGTFLSRPMLLGQNLAPLSLLFFASGVGTAALTGSFKISYRNVLILLVVLLYWGYIVVQSHLSGVSNDFALRAFVLTGGAVVCSSIFLSESQAHNTYFKIMVVFIILQCVSYAFTMLVSVLVPLERLMVLNLSIEGYQNAGNVYFPFTFVYGTLNVFGWTIPRLSGGFRESGITQAFILWAYFTLPQVGLNRTWIRVILVVGLFATLSTLAVPLYLLLSVYSIAAGKKNSLPRLLGLAVSLPLVFWLAYSIGYLLPDIGIQAKLSTGSIQDRWQVTTAALQTLQAHPFGSGAFGGTEALQGLNMVAWIGQIGLPGLLLLALCYWAAAGVDRFNPKKIVLLLPLLITWIISQPLYDAPLLFIWFFQLPALAALPKPKQAQTALPAAAHLNTAPGEAANLL